MKFMTVCLIASVLFTSICLSGEPIFVNDLVDAIAMSEATNQPVLIVFSAEWCVPCQNFKQDLIGQDFRNQLQDTIICKIDIEKDIENTKQYGVNRVPDFILLDKKKEICRHRGYIRTKFIDWFKGCKLK